MSFSLTPAAAARIQQLRRKHNNPALLLRLEVQGGGCSGFSYKFGFADAPGDGDHLFTQGDTGLVIDEVSLGFVDGGELDYAEQLIGSSFLVKNPKAASSCGCGTSFAVK
ncbi:MAG: iron-sulfur cluster insertion protein ErpA [Holosporales bacterium]|jgi:iron-sulfur cluster insertion protein